MKVAGSEDPAKTLCEGHTRRLINKRNLYGERGERVADLSHLSSLVFHDVREIFRKIAQNTDRANEIFRSEDAER